MPDLDFLVIDGLAVLVGADRAGSAPASASPWSRSDRDAAVPSLMPGSILPRRFLDAGPPRRHLDAGRLRPALLVVVGASAVTLIVRSLI